MGLDVYVGSLTRYYSFTWETTVQQAAKASGMQVQVMRPPGWAPPTVEAARARVMSWRNGLSAALGIPLGWDEDADAAYAVDKPDWDGYHGLRYFALHDEFPELPVPRSMPSRPDTRALAREPLERRYAEVYAGQRPGGLRTLFGGRSRSNAPPAPRYPHLETPELWIPVNLPEPVRIEDPAGTPLVVGSVSRLRAELESLNDRTLRLDEAGVEAIRAAELPTGGFEDAARFGFVIFLSLARHADDWQQPMKMDY